MKIIYDSKAPSQERVKILLDDGKELICGCFDLTVETTDLKSGKAKEKIHISRWGTIKQRNAPHQAVAEYFQKKA
jgi:hypothetical protein